MTTASDSNSTPGSPISTDTLCKVCILLLLGIELTTGEVVHLL